MHFVSKIVAVGLAVTVLTSATGVVALAAPPVDTANPPGHYSKQPEHQQVSVGAAHTVDADVIGEWLGVDVQPLDVEATAHVLRPLSNDSATTRATEDDLESLGAVKQMLSTAGDWAAKNVQIAVDAATRGSKWFVNNIGSSYATLTEGD